MIKRYTYTTKNIILRKYKKNCPIYKKIIEKRIIKRYTYTTKKIILKKYKKNCSIYKKIIEKKITRKTWMCLLMPLIMFIIVY